MGKLEQKKALKKEAIINSAEQIFLADGYQSASMDKIAAQANMTKQTLYRYFSSKLELFEEVLKHLGAQEGDSFIRCLEKRDTKIALVSFAKGFVRFHLSQSHLALYRLLVAESQHSPEVVKVFFDVGANQVEDTLTKFFTERFPQLHDIDQAIELWTGMLLSHRSAALVGMCQPSEEELNRHAEKATEWLLKAMS